MQLYGKSHAWILGGFEYLHADDVVANAGAGGATFRTDQIGTGQHVPYTKLMSGTADDIAVIPGDATNGLFVQVKASAAVPVTDNSGSLTVDFSGQKTQDYDTGAGTDTVLGVGLLLPASGGAVAGGTATNPIQVSLANTGANSTAVKVDGSAVNQPVTDAGGSLTVDYAGQKTMDYDSGAGTDNVVGVGLLLPASGGAVAGGTATNPIQVSLANTGSNGVAVAVSAASLPLPSGAATSAKQPALGTAGTASADVITVQGIASMTALKVDGSAVTQPVSAASLPLPTGAATAAKQPALGTAGTASADVITVQGIASMTAIKVDGSAVTQPVSGTVTANAGTGNFAQNLAQVAGTTTATGNGTASAGCQRVTIASDNTAFSVNAVQSGTWTVQPGNTQNTTAWLVTDIPATSGGWTSTVLLSAATTNATSAKGSAGQVGGWYLYNANAAVRYFKLYNKATAPTVGTDTPVMVIPIPQGSGANVEFGKGIAFSTGIAYALTTGVANSDTGAVAANEIVVNLFYK